MSVMIEVGSVGYFFEMLGKNNNVMLDLQFVNVVDSSDFCVVLVCYLNNDLVYIKIDNVFLGLVIVGCIMYLVVEIKQDQQYVFKLLE